jgi:hypothetical protein
MAEATSSGFHEWQRALRQRLVVLKAELLPLAGPEDARDMGWYRPGGEAVPRQPLLWLRSRCGLAPRP